MTQHPHPDHSGETLTIFKVEPRETQGFAVRLPSQRPDGRLDDRHSAYHDNISPAVEWEGVPNARAYALIVEDPDAPQEQPFIHWMIWNIPGEERSLPEGLANAAKLTTPLSAVQGRNGRQGHGWFGPRPPAGHGVHRYYFQMFALDGPIEMGPETPLIELLNALKAQTVAEGQAMGTYEAPDLQ